jgi:hypothetical protein
MATAQVPVTIDTPDSAGNGFPVLSTGNGFSNVRRVVPGFIVDLDGTWEGAVRVPQNYASGAKIILSWVCNATTGVLRSIVSTTVIADGESEDTAYTAETAVDTTVPGTAKFRKDVSFTLTTVPVAGDTLNVKVTRNGANAADTLAVTAMLWECVFEYTTT